MVAHLVALVPDRQSVGLRFPADRSRTTATASEPSRDKGGASPHRPALTLIPLVTATAEVPMNGNSSGPGRGSDGRIEVESLASAHAPETEALEVDGHGIDEPGSVETSGVFEALEEL